MMLEEENSGKTRLSLTVLLVAVVFVLFVSNLKAFDLWWHVRAGEYIVKTYSVPDKDIFSYTAADRPWTYHSWLSGVVLFLVHSVAGLNGLVFFRAVVMTTGIVLAWVAARRRGVGPELAGILILAVTFQLLTRALMRPFILSFIFLMIFYLLIQGVFEEELPSGGKKKRGQPWPFLWGSRGRLILLPVLMVLWVNVHGGFVIGFLLLGAYGVAEIVRVALSFPEEGWFREVLFRHRGSRFQGMFAAGAMCLAASLITPYGAESLTYPFRLFSRVSLVQRVHEWQAMPREIGFAPFWVLLGIAAVLFFRSAMLSYRQKRFRRDLPQLCADLLLMVGFGAMAVKSVRNLAWFVLLAPAILGFHFTYARRLAGVKEADPDEAGERRFLYRIAVYIVMVAILSRHFGTGSFEMGAAEDRLPVRACNYLDKVELPGPLYNVYEWGGYLIYRFWPEHKVFIDGRCLVYGNEGIQQAIDVAEGNPGWQEILKEERVRWIIVRYRARDSAHFFEEGDWRCVHWDDTALVAVSQEVQISRRPNMRHLKCTNPVGFQERLPEAPLDEVLKELDIVLERNPDSWTARAFRAEALLRRAREAETDEERQKWLRRAAKSAALAVDLNKRSSEPWRALGKCYKELGREGKSRQAFIKANKGE